MNRLTMSEPVSDGTGYRGVNRLSVSEPVIDGSGYR